MKRLLILLPILIFAVSCATAPATNEVTPELPLTKVSEFVYVKNVSDVSKTIYVKHECAAGEAGNLLAYSIISINGVQTVYPSNYEFVVGIPECYRWDEIMPKIYEVIYEFIEAYDKMQSAEDEAPKESI